MGGVPGGGVGGGADAGPVPLDGGEGGRGREAQCDDGLVVDAVRLVVVGVHVQQSQREGGRRACGKGDAHVLAERNGGAEAG